MKRSLLLPFRASSENPLSMHLYGEFYWLNWPTPAYGASMGENRSFFTEFLTLRGMMRGLIAQ